MIAVEIIVMPGKKHLRGVSAKEQRQYEHIKQSAERSGRYGGRAKEDAAPARLRQHKTKGHSKGREQPPRETGRIGNLVSRREPFSTKKLGVERLFCRKKVPQT